MEGTPFGRYRLIELLGRGGMGEVWRAYDTGTDRIVALKLLPAHLAEDPSFEQRFRREAHSAARLNNAHIVPIHDYGEIDGRLYVDMALIDGHDLAGEIAGGPLAPARAAAIVEQIALALQAAHKTGLVHRDIKPSNILIGDDDTAYLIDFGIARSAVDARLTGTDNTIGTWAYMAPERFTTDDVDPRSDTYALACVLYEALTGTKPFPGDSMERQVTGHLHNPPPRPSATRADLPPAFDAVVAVGMAKDPQQRFQTAPELAATVRGRTRRCGPVGRPRGIGRRRRTPDAGRGPVAAALAAQAPIDRRRGDRGGSSDHRGGTPVAEQLCAQTEFSTALRNSDNDTSRNDDLRRTRCAAVHRTRLSHRSRDRGRRIGARRRCRKQSDPATAFRHRGCRGAPVHRAEQAGSSRRRCRWSGLRHRYRQQPGPQTRREQRSAQRAFVRPGFDGLCPRDRRRRRRHGLCHRFQQRPGSRAEPRGDRRHRAAVAESAEFAQRYRPGWQRKPLHRQQRTESGS
ncbi:serine/threonine protein kinase [Mycolicibacterium insubricum]|nr:serine/threonine protein kinase [Mycolicibacterium insubricum]